jgi:glutamyl-tRNA synthetase
MPNLQDRMDLMPTYRLTRLAPTPSGFLHVGNLMSFALTAGLARRHGASILLRIDDLDRQRMRREYLDDIFDTLRFAGIPWDEGPRDADDFLRNWSQSHRQPLYREALNHLCTTDAVFACTCSRSELFRTAADNTYPGTCRFRRHALEAPGMAWRLMAEPAGRVRMRRPDGCDEVRDLPGEMRHLVVRKRDGDPSYQLASVVDDLHYRVDLVVRGEDLLPSTLAQLHVSGLLPPNPFGETSFLHHPLLRDAAGGKLSKSAGAASIRHLRLTGMDRMGLFRHLSCLLGMKEPASDWGGLFEAWVRAGRAGGPSFH